MKEILLNRFKLAVLFAAFIVGEGYCFYIIIKSSSAIAQYEANIKKNLLEIKKLESSPLSEHFTWLHAAPPYKDGFFGPMSK